MARSRLGIQTNHGNVYEGGQVRGYFNLPNDLQFSQFTVQMSEAYHLPSNPIPDNGQWFSDNGLNDEIFDIGDVGPGGQMTFFGDPTRLCDYWDDVKALKTNDPKLFLIKVAHIIRYFDIRPWLTMPDCINLDPVFINLCGLHESNGCD